MTVETKELIISEELKKERNDETAEKVYKGYCKLY